MTFFFGKAEAIYDPTTVELARMFGKDIFEMNGTAYLQPMVQALNATSNSRFFNSAFVPFEVEKPYFKFSLNAMVGFVPEDQKTYIPKMPMEEFDLGKMGNYVDFTLFPPAVTNIKDTAGLMYYALKSIIYNGVKDGSIKVPGKAATILGNQQTSFNLPHNVMESLVRNHPVFPLLPKSMQDSLLKSVANFPESFTLPPGANFNTLFAGIPQLEIGSLWGTEALIRFIPRIDMGSNIGKFMFWGFGLKHCISQDFEDFPLDLAVQVVYQGTSLKNTIGVTNAELEADGTFWDINIHASKHFEDIIDVYTGFSFDFMNIKSKYKYFIPVETQWQLGLLRKDTVNGVEVINPPEPELGYPGDTKPQTANMLLEDSNFKWVIGVMRRFGPVAIYLDYNWSKFSIFTAGLQVTI